MSARFRRRGREAHTIACPFCSQESTHMIEFERSLEPVPLTEPAPADGWVRVEDRLPEGYGSFLTASAGGYLEITFFDADRRWQRVHNVTHWRPLPAPPVVEGGK